MTVDRTGTAWIIGGGNVYKTSTTTAACALAPQWQPQTGFEDFEVVDPDGRPGSSPPHPLPQPEIRIGQREAGAGTGAGGGRKDF